VLIDTFNNILVTTLDVTSTNDARSVLTLIWFVAGSRFIYVIFSYTGVHHDFHIRWCSCR